MRPALSQPGLLVMDMDSTLIRCECIDEIGDFLGIKPQIAEITQRAMRGELEFSASLTERVQLLAGLDASVLDRVYEERISLTEGAETLITTLHANGWKVGLVSGGFTYFTDKFKLLLELDFTRANVLEIHNGKLTGSVLGDIVDAESKRHTLLEQAGIFSVPMSQTVAIGDGANDLPMIKAAGMGIAFHAKPMVQKAAPYAINNGGLDKVLDLLG
ncbi:MAG: phosphoserine phosphatase SerB [Mariprofundaceae bacterium]|nr:phosphoserine phosphatase SerB [Mariprofundaceae bacterium]